MKATNRVIISIACLLAAIACYFFGVPAGGGFFLLAGLMFEGMFWLGVLGKKKK